MSDTDQILKKARSKIPDVSSRFSETEDENTDENHERMEADVDTEAFLSQAPDLSLNLSREQTPNTEDDATSTYTDLAPGSPSPDNETGSKRGLAPSLDIDNAVIKKARVDEIKLDPAQVPLASIEKQKKRVTGRAIEKQWVCLESESFRSFENLCTISMNSVLERYNDSKQRDTKVAETQRIFTQHWLSTKLPKSFLARLKITKLPPLRSLVVKMRGGYEESFDPLNVDQVNLRKTVFETYLLAELKQLESLEAYKNSLENTYNLDLEYLKDFKKTTSNLRGQISQERGHSSKELRLDLMLTKRDSSESRLKRSPLSMNLTLSDARFDPSKDSDLELLIKDIHTELCGLTKQKRELLTLSDQLDIIERQLYNRGTM